MRHRFRVSADGFLDVRDHRRVRTPGKFERHVDPTPEDQALAFLLSHSFPGHRRVVRPLKDGDRRLIQLALWADSVSERMTLVDRVWRSVTEPVLAPVDHGRPWLIQVVAYGDTWAYPIYVDGDVTHVIPFGGLPLKEVTLEDEGWLDLKSA
ncbi:MAG: hypothetical protein PVI57_14445 [Gemmatimonadota bacterium]|jgi:hypothetical protein